MQYMIQYNQLGSLHTSLEGKKQMVSDKGHNERIITQFSTQSKRFDSPDYSLSNPECLEWAIGCLPLRKDARVLDIAAGTGLLSLSLSPYVHSVTAVDITQAMLNQGRRSAAAKGITNVAFRLGDAYSLSETNSYDITVSRLAFHHLTEPERVLRNMVRALHPDGHAVVFDLISPDEKNLAMRYNALERLRDNSHTTALKRDEMIGIFESCGLRNISAEYRHVVNNLEAWMTMTDTPERNRRIIRAAMQTELAGGQSTGFAPFAGNDGQIMFAHNWMMIQGKKPDNPQPE